MRKLISGILLSAMLTLNLSSFTIMSSTALAAESDAVITFNDYVSDDSATLPNGFVDQNYSVNTTNDKSRRVKQNATGGVYGKESDDMAYTLTHQWLAESKQPSTRWYQTRYNANLSGGEYVHFATELAYEYAAAERKLAVGVTTASGNADINNIVKISRPDLNSAELIMSFFDMESIHVPKHNGWMKFDVVIECETGFADVYYNGEQVVEKYETGVTGITQFRQGIFCIYQCALSNKSFGQSVTYVDNVLCAMPQTKPEIAKFTPYEAWDFEDYSGGFDGNLYLQNTTTTKVTEGIAKSGVFGKAADDVSFLARAPYASKDTDSGTSWQQVRFNNLSTRMPDNYPMFYKISFEMAYTGQNMNRILYFGSTAWASSAAKRYKNDHKVIQIEDDILSVNGEVIETDEGVVAENIWMKFDIVVKCKQAAGAYDVYLNGKKIAEDVAMTFKTALESYQTIEKIHMLAFAINHEASQAADWAWPECDTYLDNVSISSYGSYPYIETVETEEEQELISCTYYADGIETDNIFKANSVKAVINDVADAVPLIAVYNGGVLKSILTDDDKDMELSASFNPGDKVKLMMWDSLQTMKPVHDVTDITVTSDLAEPTASEFAVSGMFTDGAVLQRNKDVNIWGTSDSDDGTTINVIYGDNAAQAVVSDGKWSAKLKPMEASVSGKTLYVYSADGFEAFDDIVVGDVYFVAGQSNAELPMSKTEHYKADKALVSESDNIRFFYQNRQDAFDLSDEERVVVQENPINPNYKWEIAKPHTIGRLSAIGYYFADKVSETIEANVPVGLIQTAFGSARLQELSPACVNDIYGYTVDADRIKYNAYNTLVAPAEKYSARGMLWYQGESDSTLDERTKTYTARFNSLMEYVRDIQGDDFPVFFVQLSSHTDYVDNGSQGWTFNWKVPRFRNIQNGIEDVTADTYMVPSLDLGLKEGDVNDTAHPIYKKEIGYRLADVAIERLYKENGDIDSVLAAKVKSITYDATGATVEFERVNGALTTVDGKTAVLGFELIKDGVATAATAEIIDDVTVRVTGVENPTGVRYAYYNAASPAIANLKSGNGLPCPTFSENGFDVEPLTLGQER